jgi:predicted outer membrane repeat protein
MRTKAAMLLALLAVPASARAASFSVTNLTDGAAPGPVGSLRKAISDSNAAGGSNSISFSVVGTITLSAGQLDITASVSIVVPVFSVFITALDASRVFHVGSGATVTLFGMILEHGHSTGSGGVILNEGTLTVQRCILAFGTSVDGAGIANLETLIVTQTSIVQNQASASGGGVLGEAGTTTLIAQSTLAGNTAATGGALRNFSGTEALLTNVTVSLNTTTGKESGAVEAAGPGKKIRLESCTVTQNVSSGSGSVAVDALGASAEVKLHNTIVAGNTAPAGQLAGFSGGTITTLGHNISSDGTGNLVGAGDWPNTDPKLGTLAPYGGVTNSHSLLPGSPAIDSGDDAGAPTTDQRGRPRPATGDCSVSSVDIGAFEVQAYTVTSTADSGAGTMRQAVLDNNTFGGGVACVTVNGTAHLLSVFDVAKNLDVQGPASGSFTLDGNGVFRIFHFASGVAARLERLSLTHTSSQGGDGGAILNEGSLTVRVVFFSGNTASSSGNGGAIASSGPLVVDKCAFRANTAGGRGGGIATSGSAQASITASDFISNLAVGGAALYLASSGTTALTNLTISDSFSSSSAAAVEAAGTGPVTLESCTIASNVTEGSAGGIRAQSGATVSYRNTIVAGNGGSQFAGTGTLTSLGHNLSSDGTGNLVATGDLPSTDPLLAPFSTAPAGGGIFLGVRTLRLGSPAIDAGDPAQHPAVDERGSLRPALAGCGGSALPDIGAFEAVRITVLNTLDSNEGSLRQALQDNDSSGGGTLICFSLAPYPKTITLTSGELKAQAPVGIAGPGAGLLTLSGNGTSRVFEVIDSADITGVTIANGSASSGAGVLCGSTAAVAVTSVAFVGNFASTGGAIDCDIFSTLTVDRSLFTGNTAANGAAIFFGSSQDKALVRNSTFSGNTANGANGGVIESVDAIRLESCTVTKNAAIGSGDAAAVVASASGGSVEYLDTIVAANTAPANFNRQFDAVSGGSLTSLGHNISSDSTGNLTAMGDKPSTNPLLGNLADNGGPTLTYRPLAGSPAIDTGVCTSAIDQRGFPRPFGAACDIGAVERDLGGDVNADGIVNVSDVFYLINYLFAGGAAPLRDGNVNGDATVNVSDVFYLINYLFAAGPAPV